MDDIKITEKLRPFSHRPKTSCMIPGTTLEGEIFPALVRLYDLAGQKRELIKEIPIKVIGPVKDFTVVQDLEKGVVTVFGEKLFYHILPDGNLKFQKKAPNQHLESFSRLFLGVTKQQKWEAIAERMDFREIFPFWLRLGSLLPESQDQKFPLIDEISFKQPELILSSFRKLFLHAFRGIMVPRTFDDDYQGILNDFKIEGSPLFILKKGGVLIQSLFIMEDSTSVHILPHLPPEFFEGKIIDVPLSFGSISLEWTKKKIRRVVLKSNLNGEVLLHFRSQKRFRLREKLNKEKTFFCGNPLEIKSGGVYLLDRFEN